MPGRYLEANREDYLLLKGNRELLGRSRRGAEGQTPLSPDLS